MNPKNHFILQPWSLLSILLTAWCLFLSQPSFATSCVETFRPSADRVHEQITYDLFNGEIIPESIVHIAGGIVYKVKLRIKDPLTGEVRIRDAIFKARVWGDKKSLDDNAIPGYGRTPMEYVAYLVNRLLKMDRVPPVAYRKNIHFTLRNGQVVTEGALIAFVPLFQSHARLKNNSDYAILNRVMRNPDGIDANKAIGQHWVTGQIEDVFTDYSASFSNMYGFGGKMRPFFTIREPVYNALKKLSASDFKPVIEAEFITESEVQMMLEQRDIILQTVEQLLQEAHLKNLPDSSVITP